MFGPFPKFIALYGVMFGAFGAASPFIPALLESRGLTPGKIGLVLACGTAIRLFAGPWGCGLADRSGAPRAVLAGFLVVSAITILGYLPAYGFYSLLFVSVAQAAALAPLTPISDALTLASARTGAKRIFDYGWARGMGSAAFIMGTLLSGAAVRAYGPSALVWLNAGLMAIAAAFACRLPSYSAAPTKLLQHREGALVLLRSAWFRRLLLVASLVEGSHAMHDAFLVIRLQSAGVGPGIAGLLWSESVAAEVLVFFAAGRLILDRVGAHGGAVLAAAAGILRWCILARTAWVRAIACAEPLHGLTFALMHLSCVRLISERAPKHLAARAQSLYEPVSVGIAVAILTFASGRLYEKFGASSFFVMALLCFIALPVALGLRQVSQCEPRSP